MPVQVINGVGIAGIGTGSSSQSGGGSSPSFDTDAQAFITAASITATTQQNAVNDLVLDLKAANLWTKMKALYPMVGGTSSSHKWNLKDPRDLDAAYRLVFNGGWTHSSTGALPNGTNTYADTFLTPSTTLTLNSTHLSFYSRTNNDTGVDMGSTSNSTTGRLYLFTRNGNTFGVRNNNNTSSEPFISNLNGVGYYINNRIDSSNVKLVKNGSTTTLSLTSNGVDTRSILIGAVFSLPSTYVYGSKECAFASIGDGLTDLESNLFYQIVEKFQYALGRNVNASKSFYFNRNYSNEANAFIFNGGITGSTEMSATNTLVSDLKATGLWTKMKALYPMVGGTALAHKFNLVNPIDSTSAFALTFNGGWTHSSTGALPNGSNAYADTFLIPSNNFDTISFSHISYYSRTNSSRVTDVVMGSYNSVGVFGMYNLYSRREYMGFNHDYPNTISYRGADISGTFDTRGFTCGTLNATNTKLFKNNVLVSSNTSVRVSSSIVSNLKSYIGAFNRDGSPSQFTDKECAFASMGTHLTDLESNLFYQIVEKFQYTLGRNVNATQPFYYSSGYTNEINAFIFNGGITDATQISAVNTLVTTLKTAGIWSKMKTIYPMVGGTATSHRFNLVNPVDSTSAYALTFNGGWTHSSTGAKPNGTTGYADTNLIPSTSLSLNSSHLSLYNRTNATSYFNATKIDVTNLTNISMAVTTNTSEYGGRFMDDTFNSVLSPNALGFLIGNRTLSTQKKYYKNGALGGTFNVNSIVLPDNILRIGVVVSNGYTVYSSGQCAFASIGDGLTDAEVTTFYNAVQAFQTTLGRQV